MPRSLLDQVGAMDHDFNVPGGGFANLDFFERMTTSPRITLVTMLGEGSFHQVHGGTTTNAPESAERSGADRLLRRAIRRDAGARVQGARQAGALRRRPSRLRAAHQAAPDGRARVLQARARRGHRRAARRARSRCPTSCARTSSTPSGAARNGSRRRGSGAGRPGRPPT